MTAEGDQRPTDDRRGVRSRVAAIERQPLGTRAAAFTEVHDELLRDLESEDSPPGA